MQAADIRTRLLRHWPGPAVQEAAQPAASEGPHSSIPSHQPAHSTVCTCLAPSAPSPHILEPATSLVPAVQGQVPHVFGMTASPVNMNAQDSTTKMAQAVKQLEGNLDAEVGLLCSWCHGRWSVVSWQFWSKSMQRQLVACWPACAAPAQTCITACGDCHEAAGEQPAGQKRIVLTSLMAFWSVCHTTWFLLLCVLIVCSGWSTY